VSVGAATRSERPLRRVDDPTRPPLDPAELSDTSAAIAPPAPMAKAARAFGDDYPPLQGHWLTRCTGVAYTLACVLYVPWLFSALNRHVPWMAWPFFVASCFTLGLMLVNVANTWCRSVPEPHPLAHGDEPLVGIIVPCCGEPVPMILRTVASILHQDWPRDRMVIVISDDGHDPELALAAQSWPVSYYSPPPRFSPGRDGAAKAGNLNAAFAVLVERHPEMRYVETRDCDDELGSNGFLRQTVGQLEHDDLLAFVQTVKEAQVSPGDPFNNRESMFYRGLMLSRNAANATFPCGSGVVWRRDALEDIGLFPTWNLVEDMQSGVEALRRGWRGTYLPIVGAIGQHSPEDLPNVYKQRGTWAIDTVRLVVWGKLAGLSLRQRAQFMELFLYYMHSFAVFIFVPCIIGSLFGYVPFRTDALGFLEHVFPVVLANEAWLLAINRPYNDRRRRQRHPIRDLWRMRIMWTGMAPVYIRATLQALTEGPRRKPLYKITRKETTARWYWQYTITQAIVVVIVLCAFAYALSDGTVPSAIVLLPFLYWGGLYVAQFAGFVSRSWYGVSIPGAVMFRLRQLSRTIGLPTAVGAVDRQLEQSASPQR